MFILYIKMETTKTVPYLKRLNTNEGATFSTGDNLGLLIPFLVSILASTGDTLPVLNSFFIVICENWH